MSQLSTFPSPASSKNNKPSKVSSGDDVCCAQACRVPSQPCLGNTSALNQEWHPASAARKRSWCSVWCSLGFPVISHCPPANGTWTTSWYWCCRNQTLICASWGGCHLVTHFTCGDSQKSAELNQDLLSSASSSHLLSPQTKTAPWLFWTCKGMGWKWPPSGPSPVQGWATTDHDHSGARADPQEGAGLQHRNAGGCSTGHHGDSPAHPSN